MRSFKQQWGDWDLRKVQQGEWGQLDEAEWEPRVLESLGLDGQGDGDKELQEMKWVQGKRVELGASSYGEEWSRREEANQTRN